MSTWIDFDPLGLVLGGVIGGVVLNLSGVNITESIKNMFTDKQDTVARTIWGEARGEGVQGMQAVANVIANRVLSKRKREFGRGWVGVCKKSQQFSCWNDSLNNKKNKNAMLSVTSDDLQFAQALTLANDAIDNVLQDITGGATFYHHKNITPAWNMSLLEQTAQIGNHIFYKYKGD